MHARHVFRDAESLFGEALSENDMSHVWELWTQCFESACTLAADAPAAHVDKGVSRAGGAVFELAEPERVWRHTVEREEGAGEVLEVTGRAMHLQKQARRARF
eukprot:13019315-Alexandrium_andersonii.AAC.1